MNKPHQQGMVPPMTHPLPPNAPADTTGYYGNWLAYYPAGVFKVRIYQRGPVLQCVQRTDADCSPCGTIRWQINTPNLCGLGIIEREDMEGGMPQLRFILVPVKISVISNEHLNLHYRNGQTVLLERDTTETNN